MQRFDYTYKRLGSKDRRGRKIKVCPKCGKRGAYTPPAEARDMYGRSVGIRPGSYTHLEEFDGFFTFVRASCHEPKLARVAEGE
jgi:hypothetical protein